MVAGGVAGYCYGEEGAEQAAEWAVGRVHGAGTTISASATGAWDWTTENCSSAWQCLFGD